MKSRRRRVLLIYLILLTIGVLYVIFVRLTGWGIPCAFHFVTRLWCPGCGVTTMLMSLLRLDIYSAFRANPLLLITLPLVIAILFKFTFEYVKHGRSPNSKPFNAVVITYAAALIIYGVLRNIPLFDFLAPQ